MTSIAVDVTRSLSRCPAVPLSRCHVQATETQRHREHTEKTNSFVLLRVLRTFVLHFIVCHACHGTRPQRHRDHREYTEKINSFVLRVLRVLPAFARQIARELRRGRAIAASGRGGGRAFVLHFVCLAVSVTLCPRWPVLGRHTSSAKESRNLSNTKYPAKKTKTEATR